MILEPGRTMKEVEKTIEPKCSECGHPMIDKQSIELGKCLWCRPWITK